MQYIKKWELFENSGISPKQKKFLDKYTEGEWILNPDGLVDIKGSFSRNTEGISGFLGIRFGRVSGNFDCSNLKLTSLIGCPTFVGGNFDGRANLLTSLKGAPREVCGEFNVWDNKLESLIGGPSIVQGNYDIDMNMLVSLEGAPEVIYGDFTCRNNRLKTLEGGPKKVKGRCYFGNNSLQDLKGAPDEVGGTFSCMNNFLFSIEGVPKKVGGYNFKKNPVSEMTFIRIYDMMKMIEEIGYQWAVFSIWNSIDDKDKIALIPGLNSDIFRGIDFKHLLEYINEHTASFKIMSWIKERNQLFYTELKKLDPNIDDYVQAGDWDL